MAIGSSISRERPGPSAAVVSILEVRQGEELRGDSEKMHVSAAAYDFGLVQVPSAAASPMPEPPPGNLRASSQRWRLSLQFLEDRLSTPVKSG